MPGVFISYRRGDSSGHAGRIFDHLRDHFGDRVFMDVDGIEAGVDFVVVLEKALGSCDAILAVIGPDWATALDKQGRQRLTDPNDFVRLELTRALERNVRVIPVLVDGAAMPSAQDLPEALHPLCRRQAIELRDARWSADIDQLTVVLDRVVTGQPVETGKTPDPAAATRGASSADNGGRSRRRVVLPIAIGCVAIIALAIGLGPRWFAAVRSTAATDTAAAAPTNAAATPGASVPVPAATAAVTPPPAGSATPAPADAPPVNTTTPAADTQATATPAPVTSSSDTPSEETRPTSTPTRPTQTSARPTATPLTTLRPSAVPATPSRAVTSVTPSTRIAAPLPNVVGENILKAREMLDGQGVNVRVRFNEKGDGAPGVVLSQEQLPASAPGARPVVALTAVPNFTLVIQHREGELKAAQDLAAYLRRLKSTNGANIRIQQVVLRAGMVGRVAYSEASLTSEAQAVANDASEFLSRTYGRREPVSAASVASVVRRALVLGLPDLSTR